ncbi:hypothetical protein KKR91_13635 [Arthrobacter jiangjiafuii]|uniref:Uncharacterized protein n=1 Tax=Arthrobacter jiangjiafuii TaxID=2817475 RepID=A0A975M417_9MICC|nr:hypothetical protein [Arthrobacter jiangjiafuii]MBP3042775.1 hypothetical protein [Arthrobacter jiangjiafuii]QWC09510.1 hypothetical protein KKR91_13635 [Arthrobacter jiangjiafuii]
MNDSLETTSPTGRRQPVRTATIVWGLLIMAAGILLLAWLLTDISLDPMAVLLGLLIGAGAALLIGGAVAAFGKQDKAGNRP